MRSTAGAGRFVKRPYEGKPADGALLDGIVSGVRGSSKLFPCGGAANHMRWG